MLQLPEDIQTTLKQLNSTFRMVSYNSHRVKEPKGKGSKEMKEVEKGPCTVCRIIDRVTGKVYAEGMAADNDEHGAIRDAVKNATHAEKPKSPAQAMQEYQQLSQENAELKRKLEMLEKRGDGGTPKGDQNPPVSNQNHSTNNA